ncbi:MAG: N-acetyl-gamma-glutamyl-phosphate reductase [Chloroflexota bacterium]|jgi:N-acetyl-gamma-glutamyl-phosphate reductase|nr:N-acetyl-gamma-glutamyl-phosphate reductase [Chloroflexota bacterium]
MTSSATVAVIGATGYAGATAVSLLSSHPHARVVRATSRSYAGRRLAEVYPGLDSDIELGGEMDPGDAEVVFAALPHGMTGALAGKWLEEGRTVVDLGADFRLRDDAAYTKWYGAGHPAPGLLAQAVFALPELARGDLRGARLLACPGCYSTAAILALHPAAMSGLVEPDFIVDAASGISGAGRSLSVGFHFAEAAEDFTAYGLGGHRHSAEMLQALAQEGTPPRLTFVPHLVPMVRGILATCYLDLAPGASFDALKDAYAQAYDGCAFVQVVDAPPHTKEVAGTNRCAIHLTRQGDRIVVLAAIDNLVKGAAGQGVQALNLAMGWPETAGLQQAPRWP